MSYEEEQELSSNAKTKLTFLDLIDEHNQQEIKKNSKIIDTSKENNEFPFAIVSIVQTRKSLFFFDSVVPDYYTIINSFKENTEF